MLILDGKAVSAVFRARQKQRSENFKAKWGRSPGLAVVLVGDNPASEIYVRGKMKACAEVGITSFLEKLPQQATQTELETRLQELIKSSKVDGILVQLPLPKGLNEERVTAILPPEKDADGFSYFNLGQLWAGKGEVAPCTPAGVIALLKHFQIQIAGKSAVVVGRSLIVGRPMAELLLQEDATVTICHSKTKNLQDFTRRADIVVAAAGKPEFLKAEDFKEGAVVVDVGIHRVCKSDKDKIVGDVDAESAKGKLQALSPVPGGVGPMTITMLLENTLILAERNAR